LLVYSQDVWDVGKDALDVFMADDRTTALLGALQGVLEHLGGKEGG